MTWTTPLLTILGSLVGAGLILVGLGFGVIRSKRTGVATPDGAARGAERRGRLAALTGHPLRLAIAAGTGLVALVLTRWPMSLPLGILAVVGSRGLGTSNSKTTIERLEAIAAWTEMLRDTLAAAAGLNQALVATAPLSPRPIRPQMLALAARLNAGVGLTASLVELSHDLADPAADNVVACLVMAASERAQRLADLLGALADSTREEVSMRLEVEASRASSRTAVRVITGFSFGLLALMAVFSRSYLSPYGTAAGQLVLGLVGCIYGLGLWLMSAMARTEPFPRLEIAAPAGS